MEAILRSIHPNAGSVAMYSSNIANKEKRVVIVIDGVHYTLSAKLSADFRAKTVSISDLGDYVVRDAVAADGTALKSLGYPGEDIIVNVNWGVAAPKVKTLTVAELEALVAF